MTPLRITAHIADAVSIPDGAIALDALLMAAVARRDNIPPPPPVVAITIPVELEPGGRFHLASSSVGAFECHEVRWVNRRFPIEQAQTLSTRVTRVSLSGGPSKSYRLPLEVGHLVGDRLDWWCLGDLDGVRELLGLVGYVGKKRATGLGRVARWVVETCEEWVGFPVVRDGKALRPLPVDWPGLEDPETGMRVLSPPYWERWREELCAVPG